MFAHGRCFMEPKERCFPGDPTCNIMGMGAYKDGARGALYLATREAAPFCGKPNFYELDVHKMRFYILDGSVPEPWSL